MRIPACAGEPGLAFHLRHPPLKVYPRVCGGTVTELEETLRYGLSRVRPQHSSYRFPVGLSPRVRGNQIKGTYATHLRRSIPACAGEPVTVESWGQGLSPRVRGNPPESYRPGLLLRSIPACAGEPVTVESFGDATRVYPRVCGGTRLNPTALDYLRSIPACAGEPIRVRNALAGRWVYPRVCGGTRLLGKSGQRVQGLSPRVRGNLPDVPSPADLEAPRVCGGTY